jgi:hypothetical protein
MAAVIVDHRSIHVRAPGSPSRCTDRPLPASIRARTTARPHRVAVASSPAHADLSARTSRSMAPRMAGPVPRGDVTFPFEAESATIGRSSGAAGRTGVLPGISSRTESVSVVIAASLIGGRPAASSQTVPWMMLFLVSQFPVDLRIADSSRHGNGKSLNCYSDRERAFARGSSERQAGESPGRLAPHSHGSGREDGRSL